MNNSLGFLYGILGGHVQDFRLSFLYFFKFCSYLFLIVTDEESESAGEQELEKERYVLPKSVCAFSFDLLTSLIKRSQKIVTAVR